MRFNADLLWAMSFCGFRLIVRWTWVVVEQRTVTSSRERGRERDRERETNTHTSPPTARPGFEPLHFHRE